jgi:hypothetical protein
MQENKLVGTSDKFTSQWAYTSGGQKTIMGLSKKKGSPFCV